MQVQPHNLILTELKISSRQQRKNLYRRLLGRDYVLTYSLLPGGSLLTSTGREPRTKAGVLIAVGGGGDTVAALHHAGVADDMTFVSTAGGAFLEWMEGKPLPGVEALQVK